MKYIAIIALALSLIACASTKPLSEEPFGVDLEYPKVPAGIIEAQFDKLLKLSGIKTVNVTVSYYPLNDVVCLQYKLEFMTFYHFFDRTGRDAFIKALEQYKEEFEQKALNTKGSKKTRRKYGLVDTYLIWQASAYTVRAKAMAITDFGYDIRVIHKNRASFFTIYRRETSYAHEMSKQDVRTAPNQAMFLTRAQASELAELFDQEYLLSLVPETMKKKGDNTIDTY